VPVPLLKQLTQPKYLAIALAVIAIIGIIITVFLWPSTGFVELTSSLGAKVTKVTAADGKVVPNVSGETPLRLALSAGVYDFELTSEGGVVETQKVEVKSGTVTAVHHSFAGASPPELVRELLGSMGK
jgi:hypothetical protein